MGPLTTVPAAASAPPDRGLRVVPRSAGAVWHHNLSTVDVDALEDLYSFLGNVRADAPPLTAWERGLDAVLVTVYRELLVRGGRAIFAGDNLGAVTVDEVNAGLTPVCESPVCSADHDRDGRHLKAAHL